MKPLFLESDRKINQWPHWPDARGWVGIGVFGISVMLIQMMQIRELREDEFFQTIATVIISNGLMAVVAWAYAATKGGGELADKNAAIVAESAAATVVAAAAPAEVKVVNTEEEPVPTTGEAQAEELPEYAR